jgi:hypothetical protein
MRPGAHFVGGAGGAAIGRLIHRLMDVAPGKVPDAPMAPAGHQLSLQDTVRIVAVLELRQVAFPVLLDHLTDRIARAAGLGLLRSRIPSFADGQERLAGAGAGVLQTPGAGVGPEGQPALDGVDAVEEGEALAAGTGNSKTEPRQVSVEVLDASRRRWPRPFTELVREHRGRHGEPP